MRHSSGLDVRLPIGGLFSVLGLVLTVYGATTAGDPRSARTLPVNVNLWWGVVMLVFGLILLLAAEFGRRRAAVHPAAETPEGQATEAREHELGLEG